MALSSWRTVIGGSSGAQRCDMVVVEKSVKSIFALKRVRVSVSCSECRTVSPRS